MDLSAPILLYVEKWAAFIITTYEGKIFDWGFSKVEALREQLLGVQKGTSMKPIFAQRLSMLFPTPSSENQQMEATGFSEIPPATHELVAILHFGKSYELVEWLGRRL